MLRQMPVVSLADNKRLRTASRGSASQSPQQDTRRDARNQRPLRDWIDRWKRPHIEHVDEMRAYEVSGK